LNDILNTIDIFDESLYVRNLMNLVDSIMKAKMNH